MLDVKKQYFNSQNSLNYLGNKNDLFWDYVNLSVYTYNIISESKNLKFSLFSLGVLFYNFINHIVTSYRLLTENMEQEYLIMLRQSYEVFWLQRYFYKHPCKERQWVLHATNPKQTNRIEPWMIRAAFPNEKEYTDKIYEELSGFVHNNFKAFNGVGLGGFYDEYVIDVGMRHIIMLIDEMLQLLYKILSHRNNRLLIYSKKKYYNANDELKGKLIYAKLNYSIEQYRKLTPQISGLFNERDYEQEAIDKMIELGYL